MINIVKYQDFLQAKNEIDYYTKNINDDCIKKIYYENCEQTINELLQISLFNNTKVYKIFNCDFLTSVNEFNECQELFDTLQTLNDVDVYLFCDKKTLSNAEFKAKIESFRIIEIKPITDKNKEKIIRDTLIKNELILNKDIYAHLLNCLVSNYAIINNEISKIAKLIKNGEYEKDDIFNLICNYNVENIFKLIENILLKHHIKTWTIYLDLINKKNDEIQIINALALQLKNVYFSLKLLRQKYSIDEIAKHTGITNYFLINNKNKFDHISINTIQTMMMQLYELELKIKIMQLDKSLALKNLIIKWLEIKY